MAKHFRKVTTAMRSRFATHTGPGKKPGSQNRKKAGFMKTPKQ